MDRKLIDYLPPFLQEYKELKIINHTEQEEIEQAWEAAEKLLKEPFLLSASTYGISRIEKILKIQALDTDDLETRMFRVLLKLNEVLPYTYRTIKRHLDEICGKAEYELQVHSEEFTIDAIFEIEERQKLVELGRYLDEVLPANLVIFFAKRSRLEFAVPILYKNILKMRSEFYPRYNKPLLSLNGDWLLDGKYTLNSYKDAENIEFYPIRLQLASTIKKDFTLKNQVKLKGNTSFLVETSNLFRLKSEMKETPNTKEQILVSSSIKKKKVDIKEHLTIEKDLWFLDGTYLLDGTKLLDAEIIEQEL